MTQSRKYPKEWNHRRSSSVESAEAGTFSRELILETLVNARTGLEGVKEIQRKEKNTVVISVRKASRIALVLLDIRESTWGENPLSVL